LVDQAKAPFLNPMEMNNADKATVVNKVQNASYADEFIEVFGTNAFSNVDQAYDNIAAAIAVFETSSEMNPFTSKFDAVMDGNASLPRRNKGASTCSRAPQPSAATAIRLIRRMPPARCSPTSITTTSRSR